MRVAAGGVAEAHVGVLGARYADIDRAVRAGQRLRGPPGRLDRLERGFEEDALLRVHLLRLAGRDAEEGRVVHDAGAEGIGAAGFAVARMQQQVDVPAVGRNLGDEVGARAQLAP